MGDAVLAHRAQQVVAEFAASGASDHEQVRVDRRVDEHVLRLALGHHRVHVAPEIDTDSMATSTSCPAVAAKPSSSTRSLAWR
jgi:hypothetical protein